MRKTPVLRQAHLTGPNSPHRCRRSARSPHLPALDLDALCGAELPPRPSTRRRVGNGRPPPPGVADWRNTSFSNSRTSPAAPSLPDAPPSTRPPSGAGAAECPLAALARKEGTSRKLLYMMEAMDRRRLDSATGPQQPSTSGYSTPDLGSQQPSDPVDGEEHRPATRGGRPLTGSLNHFATPLGSPVSGNGRLGSESSKSADTWIADNAHTLSLLAGQKYTKAYVCVSALLSHYSGQPVKSAILRNRRGLCSFALMNYKECIDDFHVANRLLSDCRRAGVSPVSSSDLNEAEMMRTWIKALIMREDYRSAEQLYNSVMDNRERLGISTVECKAMNIEKHSLGDVEKFRSSVSREKWAKAMLYLSGAKCIVEETPLRTVQAVAYLETGQVDLARETLLPYLPIIPLPLKADAAMEAPPEERQLRCNVEAHYLLTTVLLAKASVYSGRQYMNIAAALTQRCLLVHPCYPPAIRIGNYLLALEDYISKIEQLVAQRLFDTAVETIGEALKLDPANTRICAVLLSKRGETRLEQGKFHHSVEDCTRSIQLDPSIAKTYFIRGKAYASLHCEADAAADRAMAIQLNPAYEAILNEELEQRAEEARRQRQQQQRDKMEREAAARPASRQHPKCAARPPSTAAPKQSGGCAGPRQPQPDAPIWSRQAPRNATLYDVLSVPMKAPTENIRQAFKRLTLQCHPDKMVNESEANQLKALEMFKAINHAHSVLCDPVRRAEYDLTILIRGNQ